MVAVFTMEVLIMVVMEELVAVVKLDSLTVLMVQLQLDMDLVVAVVLRIVLEMVEVLDQKVL